MKQVGEISTKLFQIFCMTQKFQQFNLISIKFFGLQYIYAFTFKFKIDFSILVTFRNSSINQELEWLKP